MKKHPFFLENASQCDASGYKPWSKEDFTSIVAGRDILIWGAGQKGRGFYKALIRNGFSLQAFIDSSEEFRGQEFEGVPIRHPDELLSSEKTARTSFILTATVNKKNRAMKNQLRLLGLIEGKDYADIQLLSPFYPTVEITGVCNLQCSSCPRSDLSLLENGEYMSLSDYERIVRKLVLEIPFLYLVDLYIWGEPILNKNLPDIIRLNNSIGLATGISTNLNNIRNLRRVIESKPAQIRVSLSGMSAETYELTHTNGKWKKVEKNLSVLSRIISETDSNTIVELYFHIYRHNLHEIDAAKKMCDEYGFRFHPALGVILQPLVLKEITSGVKPESAKIADDRLLRSVESLLNECKEQSAQPCILTRVAPVINWDSSVLACCSFTGEPLFKSYLDVSLAEIINHRTYSTTCGTCQSNALHRWNNQASYTPLIEEVLSMSGS